MAGSFGIMITILPSHEDNIVRTVLDGLVDTVLLESDAVLVGPVQVHQIDLDAPESRWKERSGRFDPAEMIYWRD